MAHLASGQSNGSLQIDASLNTKGFQAALKQITQSVKKFGSAVGVSFGVDALIDFGKEAIALAADLEDAQGGWADKTRLLSEQWEQFVGLIGTELIQVLTPALDCLNQMMPVLIQFTEDFFGKLAQIDLEPAKNALSQLWEAVQPFGNTIGQGLSWLWDNVLMPIGQWVIEDGVPTFLDLLSGAISFLDPIIEAFKENFQWFWDTFLQPIAEWTGGVIVSVLEDLADELTEIGDWMRDNQQMVETTAAAVTAFFAAWQIVELMSTIQQAGGIVTFFNKLTTAIKACTVEKIKDIAETAYLNLLYAKDFVVSVAQGTVALVKQAAQWAVTTAAKAADTVATWASQAATLAATAATWLFNAALTVLTSPITLVILAIGALIAIVVLCVKHWDEIKEAAAQAWDWIKEKWTAAGEWFSVNVTEPIKNFFTNLGDSIKNAFSAAWTWIQEVWLTASTWVNDTVIVPIASFFSGLWDGIKNAFTTAFEFIKTAFKTYVNGWIGIVEGFINFFIKAINLLIKGLNKISFNIPDWLPGIGGKTFGFNIREVPQVSIPRLATGAVIPPNAEFAAILGDQKHGRNLEAPEGLIRQIVKEESGANLTVILQMPNGEEKEVFSTKKISRTNRQSGRILIPITEV